MSLRANKRNQDYGSPDFDGDSGGVELPRLGENTPVRTDVRTIGLVIFFTAISVASYISLKSESTEHGKKIDAIQVVQTVDHDALVTMSAVLKNVDENVRDIKKDKK